MSNDSKCVDVDPQPSTNEGIVSRLFYSKKKTKTLQPLARVGDAPVQPITLTDNESESSEFTADNSILDPHYIPDYTTVPVVDSETEIGEYVAGPSGIWFLNKDQQGGIPWCGDTDKSFVSDAESPTNGISHVLCGDSEREGESAFIPKGGDRHDDNGGSATGVGEVTEADSKKGWRRT